MTTKNGCLFFAGKFDIGSLNKDCVKLKLDRINDDFFMSYLS
jgi:hypothetical protein